MKPITLKPLDSTSLAIKSKGDKALITLKPTPLGRPTKTDITELHKLYAEAQNGLRRVIALGLFCHQIKGQLKHGEFQKWLVDNCPKLSYLTLRSYMALTTSVLESTGIQMFSALNICQGGSVLLLPEKKVPEAARELREKICSVIDGKSARQLFLEFKTAEEDKTTGALVTRTGAGRHHPPKKTVEEKVDAKFSAAEEEAKLLITSLQVAIENGVLALISEPLFNELDRSQQALASQLRAIKSKRGNSTRE